MNLKEWALANGVHPMTAYSWFKAGTLPVRAERVGPRLIMVFPDSPPEKGEVALYARVSSSDQKDDLERQMARLAMWAAQNGVAVSRMVSEIGSGMNGRRTKLAALLKDPQVQTIVVEHRDRFGRMNTELVEASLAAHGRELVVVDDSEMVDDLVRDMTEVLTSFCARLYGRRGAAKRAERALSVASTEAAQ